MQKFVDNYKKLGISSVAFPWMGAMNGDIPIETIKSLTRKYLSTLNDLDIEVYDFDPNVPCDLYNALEYRNRMYGDVRGRKTKVGRKLLRFPPTRI